MAKSRDPFMELKHDSNVTALSVLEFPDRIVSGCKNNLIYVWDRSSFSLIQTLSGHDRSILALSSVRGEHVNYLISSSSDRTVRVWKEENGQLVCFKVFKEFKGHVLCVRPIFQRNKLVLALGLQDSSIMTKCVGVLNQEPDTDWKIWNAHRGYVYAVDFDEEGYLYSASGDGCIKMWKKEQHVGTMQGHVGSVLSLCFVDRESLFSGGHDKCIRCWDTKEMICRGILKGHKGPVLSICASSGSGKLMSASSDHKVYVWSTETLRCLYRLNAHDNTVTSVKCANSFLYSACLDEKLRIWDINSLMEDTAHTGLSPKQDTDTCAALFSIKAGLSKTQSDDQDAVMIQLLRKFVSFPSVSGQREMMDHCWMAAKYLKTLLGQLGAECYLQHCGPSINPIVLGKLGNDDNQKTILITGHYDVQPADAENDWHSNPFYLTGKNGFLYGRGATDDKGPIICILFAIRTLVMQHQRDKTCSVPNFVFLFQGEGENGSNGFHHAVEENLEYFKNVDVIFASNNYWLGDDVPCLTYGMRGCLELRVQVSGPQKDLHSGVDGGVVREPMHDLLQLTNKLIPTTSGDFSIPGFADNIRPIDDHERSLYRDLDFDLEAYREKLGIQQFNTDHSIDATLQNQQILMQRWRLPTMSITGINCSINNKSIIPRSASANISIRTVPDQDPQTLEQLVTDHIQTTFHALQSTNTLQLHVLSNVPYWIGDTNNGYYKKAEIAITKHWQRKPIYVREGGTSQNTSYLEKTIGAPCLHFPLGQASDGAHLPNERIRLSNLSIGKRILVDFFASV